MKIAFPTSSGEGLDAVVGDRFARSPKITVVEVDEGGRVVKAETIDNEAASLPSGAGTKFVQKLVELGINAVAGPRPGPHAETILKRAGIRFIEVEPGKRVRDVLEAVLQALKS